ncbi:MAG: putative toxin-antitoxin system toxin component, PIN family [Chloroflexi bacterium]|nr:putative toxin-antitoxin system toxin component, PIN family [Chloroflexota bacterium]
MTEGISAIRAVVDTNIMIRALIKPHGTVGPVLSQLALGSYVIVYSESMLDELIAKLALPRIRTKYAIDDESTETTVALLAIRGELVRPTRNVKVCRDPKDDMLIEAALAGNARYLVTGDEDLLVLKNYEAVRIVTPRTFLAALLHG